MKCIIRTWERFCRASAQEGKRSIPASAVSENASSLPYLVLKHDVETKVEKAFRMAKIEQRYGHCGSYYVQAYLLDKPKNVALLQRMQAMGHEISYHYDVLDAAMGDYTAAAAEFERNLQRFRACGFPVTTVCQHGNPVVVRNGYTSNRDFFRNEETQLRYPVLADIMVDFPRKAHTSYLYFSDAGRALRLIADPLTNDRSPDKGEDKTLKDFDALKPYLAQTNCIVSMHPHRWSANAAAWLCRSAVFFTVRQTARLLMKLPPCKKLMSRYFYLAKKI